VGDLVLSLFPGGDLLGMAFELEGFCVVAGPDVIFGRNIRDFHPPTGRFDGVIGGPPCQAFSQARNRKPGLAENLIPEFERCITEAQPQWFLMENVRDAPVPSVPGYLIDAVLLNNRWLGQEQNRNRRFSFGTPNGRRLHVQLACLEPVLSAPTVLATEHKGQLATRFYKGKVRSGRGSYISRRALNICCELQGLPPEFTEGMPFTLAGKYQVVGNGVPLPMGRAVAQAVKRALEGR